MRTVVKRIPNKKKKNISSLHVYYLTICYYVFSQDKKPLPGEKRSLEKKRPAQQQKRKYVEDSSDESDSDHQLSQTKKTSNDLPSDSDESLESTPVKSKTTSVASRLSSLSSTPVKSKPTSVASRLSALKAKVAVLSDNPQVLSSLEKVSHPVIIYYA